MRLKLQEKPASEDLTMAFNNNKGENEFPYEIKEAEGDVREQFIKDFHGKLDAKIKKNEA